ncbi:MAG: hypothetical protein RIB98_10085 [Acidimicrobiales bacterium]
MNSTDSDHPTVTERRRSWSGGHQFLALGPLLVVWVATSALLYASAAQDEVPTDLLFLDPATVGDQPWYTGLLHELGILGWAVAATAAAGGAWVAWLTGRRNSVWFLASGALLTIALLTDEVTGFHSVLGPRLGLAKQVSIGAILAGAALWFVANWHEIRRTRWPILIISLAALAMSVLLDYGRQTTSFHVFYEDAPKLFGIVGWATYFVFTTIDITRSAVRDREHDALAAPA